jgi:hypothetical protein
LAASRTIGPNPAMNKIFMFLGPCMASPPREMKAAMLAAGIHANSSLRVMDLRFINFQASEE